MRVRSALILAAALGLVACSGPAPTTAPVTATSRIAGIAPDEPCTYQLASGEALPQTKLHLEDLEAMVLSEQDLGGLPGFEVDPFRHGFQGNAELPTIEVHPDSTCADEAKLGRITGFGASLELPGGAERRVSTSVHLFATDDGAAAWSDAFDEGFLAVLGAEGRDRYGTAPLPGGRGDDLIATHGGPDGIRTWAMLVRGPIVGWVIDLEQGDATTIDVGAAAALLAARIEGVEEDAVDRPRHGLDAAALVAAPLPLAEYGPRYAGLEWDPFFGGCADAVERGLVAGEDAENDARRFHRISGCTALYAPPASDPAGPIERAFSSVQVFAGDEHASGFAAKVAADMQQLGGRLGGPLDLGDEAFEVITPGGGDRDYVDARAIVRVGSNVLTVALQDREPANQADEIATLAAKLTVRVEQLLAAAP